MKNKLTHDEKQINTWRKTVSRFRGKLVKMINNAGSKFDHWGHELTKKDSFIYWLDKLTYKSELLLA